MAFDLTCLISILYIVKKFTQVFKNLIFISFFLIISASFGQSIANYDISLTTLWNSTNHTSVPENAHWSDLIGATHNTANEFVSVGMLAATGIKDVAERGINDEITNEINAAINVGSANQLLQDGFPIGPISTAGFTSVQISEDFPFITLVSMVAPSPDWFIAINSLNLRSGNNTVNNGWKATFTMAIFAYDAGTDNGTNYTSPDSPNTPVPVAMINGFPINGNRMATITFTFNSSTLEVENVNPFQNIKVYPNPTKGEVTLYKLQNSDLKTVELYNILGSLVQTIEVKKGVSIATLNFSHLNPGIYLLKLKNSIDGLKTQKLIIE
jgi:hypothetical protein